MAKGKGGDATKAAGASMGAVKRSRDKLMPHELLLKVAQGETIDGHVPTFAQRLDAAKQALPYYAPRLSPEPAQDDDDDRLVVTVVRFSDGAAAE